jgi:hypothetical protein
MDDQQNPHWWSQKMKLEDVKVGMKVRIREWDDMERERGLNGHGGLFGTFGFSREMRKFCGKCYTVANIDGHRIELDKSFYNESQYKYSISADMLEPIVEEFTMPPPPDLGELHGVKLPAWMWDSYFKKLVYGYALDNDGHLRYQSEGDYRCHRNPLESGIFVKYTGQDKVKPVDIETLKRAARLV